GAVKAKAPTRLRARRACRRPTRNTSCATTWPSRPSKPPSRATTSRYASCMPCSAAPSTSNRVWSGTRSDHPSGASIWRSVARPRCLVSRLQGQRDPKQRALAFPAFDLDASAVGLDDLFGDEQAQAQAGAAFAAFGAFELVEDPLQTFLADADAM